MTVSPRGCPGRPPARSTSGRRSRMGHAGRAPDHVIGDDTHRDARSAAAVATRTGTHEGDRPPQGARRHGPRGTCATGCATRPPTNSSPAVPASARSHRIPTSIAPRSSRCGTPRGASSRRRPRPTTSNPRSSAWSSRPFAETGVGPISAAQLCCSSSHQAPYAATRLRHSRGAAPIPASSGQTIR
jgi:hypothetical protein